MWLFLVSFWLFFAVLGTKIIYFIDKQENVVKLSIVRDLENHEKK
jgi:hypothetical protein